MSNLELGIIGNGTVAGLVDEDANIVWLCLPRIDGEPVFNKLLGGRGQFAVSLQGHVKSTQTYQRNTAVIETVLEADDGSSVLLTPTRMMSDLCASFIKFPSS